METAGARDTTGQTERHMKFYKGNSREANEFETASEPDTTARLGDK